MHLSSVKCFSHLKLGSVYWVDEARDVMKQHAGKEFTLEVLHGAVMTMGVTVCFVRTCTLKNVILCCHVPNALQINISLKKYGCCFA